MNLLQYSFVLDSDHDMDAVRRRVAEKKHVVDGLPGMRWKAWLLSEPLPRQLQLKTYAPLYLFASGETLASFLAGPLYKGVTDAFGWTRPQIGLPLCVVDGSLSQARSVTLSSEPVRGHEQLSHASREVCALASGEVARVRALSAGTMELLTYRFWRIAAGEHDRADELKVYEVIAVSHAHGGHR